MADRASSISRRRYPSSSRSETAINTSSCGTVMPSGLAECGEYPRDTHMMDLISHMSCRTSCPLSAEPILVCVVGEAILAPSMLEAPSSNLLCLSRNQAQMLFGSSLRAAIPWSASRLDMNCRGESESLCDVVTLSALLLESRTETRHRRLK